MKTNTVILLLLLTSVVPVSKAQRPSNLTAIEVERLDPDIPISPRKYNDLARGVITDELDLGEDIENQVIILHPAPGTTTEFKIEQRFETSITVMAEGPHLDLVHWKHYYSPWREIRRVGENRFLTLKTKETEFARFPKVTVGEIKQAVLKAGGKEWAKSVRKIRGPNDYPSAVSMSKISFKIMVKEGEQWQPIVFLHFKVPMGC